MATVETVAKMEVDEEKGDVNEETTGSDKKTGETAVDSKNTAKTSGNSTIPGNPNPSQYRVKVSGLPRFYTPSDPLLVAFKKLLHDELRLDFKYIRSPKKGNSWLYITFYNQANQERALELLRNYKWQGRTLICTLVVADVLKRKQEDTGQGTTKKARLDIPIEEQMLMSTIPYHTVSYEEQLSKKNEEAQCLFKWLAVCMEKKTPQLIGYIDKEIANNPVTKLPFKLDEVRPSPVIDGYRNKCEFRVGLDPQSKKVVVGYRVDNQEDDIIAVAPPDSLRHLPKEMIDVVKVFEKYVQNSEYKPQITNHDPGVWRLLHVRINKAKQLMVVVLINPTILTDEQLALVKQDLIKYFSLGPASHLNIVSVYLHTDNDVKIVPGIGDKSKRPQGKLEHLWGETHMEEPMLDMKLDIDPNFYFQNNTWGAEVLYNALVEVAGVDNETTVLDLCCGSGGMGVTLARHCKEVIGIEVMDVNVDDAKRLAAKNGLTNCEFLQGNVDDLFPELQERLKGKKVVPVLDPPRVGISPKLIQYLRRMNEAQRIIYVCSNHKLPSKNIMDLSLLEGEKKEFAGTNPFFPTRVIPVDISPHSLRCELVILLERLDMEKLPKPTRVPPNKTARCLYFPNLDHKPRSMMRGGFRGRGGRADARQGYRSLPARDSLYPPPLRRNLYRNDYEEPPPQYGRPGYVYGPPPGPPPYRHREYDNLHRYSSLRRDMEDAIDSSYPRGHVSERLAIANTLLERGLRLAEEAMADSRLPPSLPPVAYPMMRPPDEYNGYREGPPPRRGGRNNWNGSGYPPERWNEPWEEDNYTVPAPRPGRGVRGGPRGGGLGPRRPGGGGFWLR